MNKVIIILKMNLYIYFQNNILIKIKIYIILLYYNNIMVIINGVNDCKFIFFFSF